MKALLTLLFFFSLASGYAQTTITGRVTDQQGNGIPLANVILNETYDGASTDENGNFEFRTTETGAKILVVRYLGFKEFRKEIQLTGAALSFTIALQEEINELKAVTISAGSFTASDESRRTVFKAIDIATTAGATADIAGALNTLPGTQKVGESGRLFVRGGEGNEARTFIDGLVVLDAYSPAAPNAPSRGRFLPFMFKGTSFSTGGYSAEYGQALSSALVLDSRDKSDITRTDIGIMTVGGDVAHTQAWKDGSAAGKLQYTNIRPYFNLINQEIDWKTPPAAIEGSAVFRQKVAKDGMVKIFTNFSQSDFSLYNHTIDDYNIKELYQLGNQYQYANAFYKDALNDRWMLRGGVSYTRVKNETVIDETAAIDETEKGIHAKVVAEGSLSDRVEVKTGAEVIGRSYTQDFNFAPALAFNETIAASFAEVDVYTSNKFVTRGGVRVEYNSLLETAGVDPRISLAYKTDASGQVSLAYGHFRQSPKNEWLRVNRDLASEKSEHFILNYQRVQDRKTFRIETYYKRYNNLVKFTTANETGLDNAGRGYARGVELFWRDNETFKYVDYWVSYSFLDTKRDYLDFPGLTTPAFASRHNFSFVYKHFVKSLRSQFGTTYSYTSGRPYNNPNQEAFNAGRTPHYQDVSFNWSYLPRPWLILYLSCTNLLGRDNIFSYEFSDTLNSDGVYNSRAVRQPAKRFVFIGIFITLSKDKSMSQLPTL